MEEHIPKKPNKNWISFSWLLFQVWLLFTKWHILPFQQFLSLLGVLSIKCYIWHTGNVIYFQLI